MTLPVSPVSAGVQRQVPHLLPPTSRLSDVMRCESHPSLRSWSKLQWANEDAFHTFYLNTLLAWGVSEGRGEGGNHIHYTHTHLNTQPHTPRVYNWHIHNCTKTHSLTHTELFDIQHTQLQKCNSRHYTKWNKSDRERQTLHITYMWNLENNKLENVTKEKQTHRYRGQISGYQWGERSGERQLRGRKLYVQTIVYKIRYKDVLYNIGNIPTFHNNYKWSKSLKIVNHYIVWVLSH